MTTATTATHTPGPWRVEESSHKQEFSHWVGSLSTHVMPRQSTIAGVVNAGAESEGNARLIAAAPELLQLVREARELLDDQDTEINLIDWLKAAVATIAKVDGRA